ncbi:MAG: flagellar protein FliS [Alphaproteobacteria bacterium]
MEKNENKILTKHQKSGIKVIQKLLNEMHKDIKELIELQNLEVGADKIKDKSIRISKIAIALQKSLDTENGGEVAANLNHLYKHIRFAVGRVMDDNDYSYLTSAEKVTAEINKGWEKVSTAAA